MYSPNYFQTISQQGSLHCWPPISKSSSCAFKCLFTCSTIIHAILHKSRYVITFMDYYWGDYFSFPANLSISWIWNMHSYNKIISIISNSVYKTLFPYLPHLWPWGHLRQELWFFSRLSWDSKRNWISEMRRNSLSELWSNPTSSLTPAASSKGTRFNVLTSQSSKNRCYIQSSGNSSSLSAQPQHIIILAAHSYVPGQEDLYSLYYPLTLGLCSLLRSPYHF